MNLIQSLLIFLSFVAINAVSWPYTQEDFVPGINELRRTYAKEYKVPNMHELIWSKDLVTILKPLDWSVSWPEARKTWRYTSFESYDTLLFYVKKKVDDFLKKTPKEMEKTIKDTIYTMDWMELFNPLQRFVGCTIKPEGNRKIIACLIGTEGSFTMFDSTGQSTSIPGSQCHRRYKNDDGLCVATNPEEESYYGHPQDILEDVKQIRMDYSKEYNVPNMHQLIESDDLLENLEFEAWKNEFEGARVTWRYVQLVNYIKPSIEFELNTFFNKTALEKRLFIKNNSDTTLGSLEFLNPLQKFIACIRQPNTISFICLLGTEGKFTMFDYSRNSKEIPGSNCQERYRNISGVCVAIKPEEESYFGRQMDFMRDINQIRRRYAKEYRVPNMHELTWSNELAKVLEPLNTHFVRVQVNKTWRYGALNTIDNTIYHIEVDVTRFFEMNRTAKKLYIESSLGNDTMDRLEFLNPLQKTIACGRKEDKWARKATIVICLLGPEANFTIFDTSFQSQLAAGSKCDKGYYNEDGLCIVQIPTQEPIIDYRKMAEEERNKASTEEPEPEPILENHGNGISLSYLLVFLLAQLLLNI